MFRMKKKRPKSRRWKEATKRWNPRSQTKATTTTWAARQRTRKKPLQVHRRTTPKPLMSRNPISSMFALAADKLPTATAWLKEWVEFCLLTWCSWIASKLLQMRVCLGSNRSFFAGSKGEDQRKNEVLARSRPRMRQDHRKSWDAWWDHQLCPISTKTSRGIVSTKTDRRVKSTFWWSKFHSSGRQNWIILHIKRTFLTNFKKSEGNI